MDYELEAFWSALLQPEAGPIRSPGRPRWHARAACRGVGTDVFFVEAGGGADQSWRSLCERCEVRAECLSSAMADPSTEGHWGGMSTPERKRLRRSSTAA